MAQAQGKVVITALGHFHPEHNIENAFFDELDIGSEASWVTDRTGIESRRSVLSRDDIMALRHGRTTLKQLRDEGRIMSIATMAEQAYQVMASRHPRRDLAKSFDAVICGTSVPDYDIPANACTIAGRLGIECPSFDANSACSSFVVDLHLAACMLRGGNHSRIAVFNPERYSLRMDFGDKRSCVLFGDGCAAATIEQGDGLKGLEVLDTLIVSDPAKFDLVAIPDGETFYQNGAAVQKFAITRTIEATKAILERNGLAPSDITYFTGHQANLRMVVSAAERLGLSQDRHLFNVDKFGNQGSAGAPSVLSMHWDRMVPGDLIAVAVVGSGLTWGAALLRRI